MPYALGKRCGEREAGQPIPAFMATWRIAVARSSVRSANHDMMIPAFFSPAKSISGVNA
jgi:hypothetical protein